jgi:adenosine deaminase
MKFLRPFVIAIAFASAAFAAGRPLREVLYAMPKGGDLHNHLSGAVYAETFLEFAKQDGLCVDTLKLAIVDCPATTVSTVVPATNTVTDANLYSAMLDALSMRQFRPTKESGHDHFFATFGKFGAVSRRHIPEMMADVVSRFAAENVDYVETMFAPDQGARAAVAQLISGTTPQEMYDSIVKNPDNARVLDQAVSSARKTLDDVDATMRTTLRCGTPDAKPGCESTWRCIYETYRGTPREAFFASLLVGYQLASVDPRVVGLNPVMPEDAYLPMTQFDEQMRMFEFLRTVYPKVHLTTHAGELALGLVPTEGLRHHIRDSVLIAGAERIGHGVDIAYERDAGDLMKIMATRRVAVEICLTSNDVILGVRGRQHPLRLYLEHGVPVALATDDPGVSRDDMTNQYMRAVEDQGLRYAQLKQIARNSLEYAFVEGESLWTNRRFVAMKAPCATKPKSERCSSFLAKNIKARLQWRLEERLRAFEASYGDSLPR